MSKGTKIPLGRANQLAKEVCRKIEAQCYICGSIRRGDPFVGDIDIAVITNNLTKAIGPLNCYVVDGGEKKVNLLYNETRVNLYATTNKTLGAMMLFLTGPSGYGIGLRMRAKKMGLKLTQYGLFNGKNCIASETEEDIYRALGKNYKAPSERGRN